jgi:hypothetical protein
MPDIFRVVKSSESLLLFPPTLVRFGELAVEQATEFLRTPSPRRWLGIKLGVDDSEAHASRASTTFDSRVMLVRRWSRPWNL